MSLSFFAKPPAIAKRDKHILRGSSVIRAQQLAEYLGAKYNPVAGYEDDVCIYVKPQLGTVFATKSYVDILDGDIIAKWIHNYPDVGVIVTSENNKEYLINKFHLPNKIVIIPQHHCNYERSIRIDKEVKTVEFIGTNKSFMYPIEDFSRRLAELGLSFLPYCHYRNRKDVVDFYNKIDIQVIWRPKYIRLKNSLKIANAMSFGIPTVAYPERAFQDVKDYYISSKNIDYMLDEIRRLKEDKEYYDTYARIGIAKAEEYHIDEISKLYKNL